MPIGQAMLAVAHPETFATLQVRPETFATLQVRQVGGMGQK